MKFFQEPKGVEFNQTQVSQAFKSYWKPYFEMSHLLVRIEPLTYWYPLARIFHSFFIILLKIF